MTKPDMTFDESRVTPTFERQFSKEVSPLRESDLGVEQHNTMTVFQKIKTMFRTAKLLEMSNPIGEDLRHVSYHLNCMADEVARITNLLPKHN